MTTTASSSYPFQPICPYCGKPAHGSIACQLAPGWSVQPESEVTTRIEPYFVYERIAAALERIADALESRDRVDWGPDHPSYDEMGQ